jgi:hypothetical protein
MRRSQATPIRGILGRACRACAAVLAIASAWLLLSLASVATESGTHDANAQDLSTEVSDDAGASLDATELVDTPQPRATSQALPVPGTATPPATPRLMFLRPSVRITSIDCASVTGSVVHDGAFLRDYVVWVALYRPDGSQMKPGPDQTVPGQQFRVEFPTSLTGGAWEVRVTASRPGVGTSVPARTMVNCS